MACPAAFSHFIQPNLPATPFAGNIHTIHIMLNFENKYLHI